MHSTYIRCGIVRKRANEHGGWIALRCGFLCCGLLLCAFRSFLLLTKYNSSEMACSNEHKKLLIELSVLINNEGEIAER